jgi:hypothetical protein
VLSLTHLLVQFLFRLTFGMALAMAITPPKLVTSGYYRVHLWVLMGLNTLASLVLFSDRSFDHWTAVFALAIGLATASYVGAVVWLYEQAGVGIGLLYGIALAALVAAALALEWPAAMTEWGFLLGLLDLASGGWLLGVTMAAMLLGHWYLNTPTMELVPLKRLVLLMAAAIVLRTAVSATGLVLNLQHGEELDMALAIFISLRWLSGLLGTAMMALMTWYVLKVPNTQSATGILYAGVILSFIGELASQLLSVETLYPL